MAEKYGVEQLKVIVKAVAEFLNVGSKVLNNGGFFSLFGLTGPIGEVKSVDFAQLKLEVGELSEAERKDVEAVFAQNLALQNPLVQAKVLEGENYLEDAIALVGRGVQLFNDAVVLEGQIKALVVG